MHTIIKKVQNERCVIGGAKTSLVAVWENGPICSFQ